MEQPITAELWELPFTLPKLVTRTYTRVDNAAYFTLQRLTLRPAYCLQWRPKSRCNGSRIVCNLPLNQGLKVTVSHVRVLLVCDELYIDFYVDFTSVLQLCS
jgi:hypothetical protein